MEEGDRVKHCFLGDGIIKRRIWSDLVSVLFDEDPPIRYNGGANPCAVAEISLRLMETNKQSEGKE